MDESENAGSNYYGDHLCTLEISKRIGDMHHAKVNFKLEDQGMVLNAQGVATETEIRLPAVKITASGVQTEVGVFPNPVLNNMEIRFEPVADPNIEIHLINIAGQTVQIEKFGSSSNYTQSAHMNVSALKPGAYTYLIKANSSGMVVASGRFYKSE